MTRSARPKPEQKGPRRTCAACRQETDKEELIRWVRAEDGRVFPDLSGRSFGRGAFLHPHSACLKQIPAALSRSFKAQVTTSATEALSLLGEAAEHRVVQLLGAGRRQNLMIYGTDACAEAHAQGEIHLLLVARDARAAADTTLVRQAIVSGLAQSWGTKEALGRLFGRAEIGVLGVTNRGLAKGLFGAIAMALLVQERLPSGPNTDQD